MYLLLPHSTPLLAPRRINIGGTCAAIADYLEVLQTLATDYFETGLTRDAEAICFAAMKYTFALGIPYCAISLALIERGEPVYGVVYDFSRRLLMHGGPGFGVHDGERLARVTAEEPNPEMLVGFHSPNDKSLVPAADAVLSHFKIRGLGSATLHLAYVAAGMFGGAVDFNVKIWDLAAAIALLRGAGGEIIFLNGAQLPMRTFDLRMARIIYVAGSPAMALRLAGLVAAR